MLISDVWQKRQAYAALRREALPAEVAQSGLEIIR